MDGWLRRRWIRGWRRLGESEGEVNSASRSAVDWVVMAGGGFEDLDSASYGTIQV